MNLNSIHIKTGFAISLILVITVSCNIAQNRERVYPITIDLKSAWESKESKISEISLYDSISYVPLETTDECLIQDIMKTEVTEKYIVILTRGSQILLFDREGKFIRTIGKRGKGPGELIQASQLFIEKDIIYVFDNINGAFLAYNYDGNHLKTVKNNQYGRATGGYYVKGQFVMCYPALVSSNQYMFTIQDVNGSIKPAIPYDKSIKFTMFNSSDYRGDQKHSFLYSGMTNTIYGLESDTIIEKYIYDLGKYNIETEMYGHFGDLGEELNKFIGVSDICLVDKYIVFPFWYGEEANCFLYDTITDKVYLSDKEAGEEFSDDGKEYIFGDRIYGTPLPTTYSDNILVTNEDAFSFRERVEEFRSRHRDAYKDSALERVYKKISDEDNPVIKLIYLKR